MAYTTAVYTPFNRLHRLATDLHVGLYLLLAVCCLLRVNAIDHGVGICVNTTQNAGVCTVAVILSIAMGSLLKSQPQARPSMAMARPGLVVCWLQPLCGFDKLCDLLTVFRKFSAEDNKYLPNNFSM